jgi:hypothetical protein
MEAEASEESTAVQVRDSNQFQDGAKGARVNIWRCEGCHSSPWADVRAQRVRNWGDSCTASTSHQVSSLEPAFGRSKVNYHC